MSRGNWRPSLHLCNGLLHWSECRLAEESKSAHTRCSLFVSCLPFLVIWLAITALNIYPRITFLLFTIPQPLIIIVRLLGFHQMNYNVSIFCAANHFVVIFADRLDYFLIKTSKWTVIFSMFLHLPQIHEVLRDIISKHLEYIFPLFCAGYCFVWVSWTQHFCRAWVLRPLISCTLLILKYLSRCLHNQPPFELMSPLFIIYNY